MKIVRFEDVDAWKAARKMRMDIYELTRGKAFHEDFDLRKQMRRASVSCMSNVAEGFDSGSDHEFARFLRIARRSASELQSHLYVCLDEGYLESARFDRLYKQMQDVKGLVGGFLRYLGASDGARRR